MNPNQYLNLLLFLITTLASIQIPGFFCQDQQYETCRQPFQCGNIDTNYPFWGGDRPISCGYPGFELNCQDDVPYIDISSTLYRVLEINNATQTLRIAREDLWNNLCPTFLYNTTLDSTIFSFSSTSNDQMIKLYYGCASSQTNPTALPNQFDCRVNGTTSLGFYTTRGEAVSGISCNGGVSVPVNGAAARDLENPATSSVSTLLAALVSGFWVDWSAKNQNCEDCVRSGGFCGCNPDSAAFACYCSDRPYALTCNDTRTGNGNDSNRRGMYIGFPIAGAVLAGVALAFLVFYCKKQRKQRGAAKSAKIISKEITPPPSSQSLESPPSTAFTKSIPSYPSLRSDFGKDGSNYFGAKLFDYAELEEATDNFNASRELGDGGFGVVYSGVLSDGRKVAVKRLYENNFRRVEQFMNEVEILTRLKHENLVKLHGCTSRRSRELLLVYEFVPNGTVADHLHGKRTKSALLAWPVRLNIAIETAKAIAYLHKSDIIHRDVKTNNILLDNDFHVKVADFGLSRLFPIDVTHVSTAPQGTPGYVDPEYYQCYQLTEKSDVYSFGVVLIELISSLPAVDTNRHRHDINLGNMAINRIQNHTVHELVDPSLGFETNSTVRRMVTLVVELAFRCLQQERDVRPSMDEVLEGLRAIKNDDSNANKVDIVDILVD